MLKLKTKNLQIYLVWEWWPFIFFERFDPDRNSLGLIYRWVLCIGPLTIKRWRRIL